MKHRSAVSPLKDWKGEYGHARPSAFSAAWNGPPSQRAVCPSTPVLIAVAKLGAMANRMPTVLADEQHRTRARDVLPGAAAAMSTIGQS